MMLGYYLSILITFACCKSGQNVAKNDHNSEVSARQIQDENESDIYIENQQFLEQY